MDNLNSAETAAQTEEKNQPKKRNSYVSRDHKSMVEFVSRIYRNLGHSDYHSNKAIAVVHELSPDSIKQQLTSSQQYKLLELKHGTGYKVTDLFKRIYLPVNEAEGRSAIIDSLKSPETYAPLFKEYEYHILPPVSGIKNHFVRNHQFKEDVAEKTAQIFIDNLKDYNLIDGRGVLISAMKAPLNTPPTSDTPANNTDPAKKNVEKEVKREEQDSFTPDKPKMIDIVIPLKSTKNTAHLLLPEDYKEEDLDRISKFVEALK